MKLNDIPKLMPVPFGVSGPRTELLESSPAGDRKASYKDGFPPITMLLKSAGGLPPDGGNMNQILFELASGQRWSNAGAGYKFNETFSGAVGGYPKGAQLLSNDGTKVYVSTKDDNKTDFNVSPGPDWVTLGNYIGLGEYAKEEDLNKYLAKDQNGADIQDKEKFIENLGLPEKYQPLSAMLTSLAEQQTSKGKLPFFIGKDTFTLTPLTLLGQTLISRNEATEVLGDLGIGPVASPDEITAGTAKKLIDAAGLKSFLPKRSFAVNDFIRIPDQTGGLIIQWGAITGVSGRDVITTTATFTEVFPNKCLAVSAISLSDDIGSGMCACQVKNTSNSKADLFVYERAGGAIAPHTIFVIAIGY